MNWFRIHRGFGSRLALLGLALQFIISFGHMHPLAVGSGTAFASQIFSASQENPAPAQDRHSDGDYCAICAVIQLTGYGQAASAPALPTPVSYVQREISFSSTLLLDEARSIDLRSRGPPQG